MNAILKFLQAARNLKKAGITKDKISIAGKERTRD